MDDLRQEPLRILIVSGYYDSLSGYLEVALARAMSRYGDVTVFAGDRPSPAFRSYRSSRLPDRYKAAVEYDRDVRVIRFKYAKVSSLLVAPGLPRALAHHKANVVVALAPGQFFSSTSMWLPRGAVGRAVIFGDNSAQWAVEGWRAEVKRLAFSITKGALYRATTGKADRVYGITPETLTRLKGFCPSKSMSYLPLPVLEDTFGPDEWDRARARKEISVENGERILAVVGRASPEKQLDLVLDIVEGWRSELPWRVVLSGLGDDDYGRSLRRRVEESRVLRARVTCLGFITNNELASVLRLADVCVWPKQPAITIQQALVSGSRIVVPDNELVGHLVTDSNGTAFTAGARDGLERAVAVQMAARDDASTRAGRARAAEPLTADHVARRILGEVSPKHLQPRP